MFSCHSSVELEEGYLHGCPGITVDSQRHTWNNDTCNRQEAGIPHGCHEAQGFLHSKDEGPISRGPSRARRSSSYLHEIQTLRPFNFRSYLLFRTLSRPYRHKTSFSEYGQPQTLLYGPLLLQHRQPSKVRAQLVFKTSSILWKVKIMPMLAVNAQVEPTPGAGALIPCGPPNKTNRESAVPAGLSNSRVKPRRGLMKRSRLS